MNDNKQPDALTLIAKAAARRGATKEHQLGQLHADVWHRMRNRNGPSLTDPELLPVSDWREALTSAGVSEQPSVSTTLADARAMVHRAVEFRDTDPYQSQSAAVAATDSANTVILHPDAQPGERDKAALLLEEAVALEQRAADRLHPHPSRLVSMSQTSPRTPRRGADRTNHTPPAPDAPIHYIHVDHGPDL